MLETSKDLLYITLTFCTLLFTGFLCWLLYYFIAIIRNVYGVTSGIKQKLDLIDDVLKTLKEKINSSANYIALIVNSIEKIVEHLQKKGSKKSSKKKTKIQTN